MLINSFDEVACYTCVKNCVSFIRHYVTGRRSFFYAQGDNEKVHEKTVSLWDCFGAEGSPRDPSDLRSQDDIKYKSILTVFEKEYQKV